MKEALKSIIQRLNNKGSILAIASLVVSLIVQFGVEIESEKAMAIITTITTILVALGILNDTTDNNDMYIPVISDKLVGKEEVKEEVQPVVEEKAKEEVVVEKVQEVVEPKKVVEPVVEEKIVGDVTEVAEEVK